MGHWIITSIGVITLILAIISLLKPPKHAK
jgi:uncharacterized membrane protein HdeD (DUF308 family)